MDREHKREGREVEKKEHEEEKRRERNRADRMYEIKERNVRAWFR